MGRRGAEYAVRTNFGAMLDAAAVRSLERHWEEGWNGADLQTIMEPFADHVLRRAGDIRYTLTSTFVGTDSVVLLYTCHIPDGSARTGADSMHVGPDGKVDDWRCHYTFDPAEVPISETG